MMALRQGGSSITRHRRCRVNRLPALLILAGVSFLAACGQVPGSSQEAANSPAVSGSIPTPAASTAIPAPTKISGRASTDCPVLQPPADAGAFIPDVIVSQHPQGVAAPVPITLAQGQRLEIRMQTGYRWQLALSDVHHILVLASPEGWYDSSAKACIWRFTAMGSGDAQLNYQGEMVCPLLETCPAVEQAAIYQVTVK